MSAAQAVQYTLHLEPHTCVACGVPYALTPGFRGQRKKDGKNFYCPNGCCLSFPKGPTEADRLREMLEAANRSKTELAARVAAVEAARERADKALRKEKAAAKRTATRIHAGVCPCCNRTFQNLARHMASKHPEGMK